MIKLLFHLALFFLVKGATKRVAMVGDSLINRPTNEYDLIGKLMENLSGYDVSFTNYALNGATIADILQNLPSVSATNPDAYMLYWDTDVSDHDDGTNNVELRVRYQHNLEYLIRNTTANGAYLVVAGPGLLGEGRVGKQYHFWGKDPILQDYRDINRQVCSLYNIDYIDMRAEMLRRIHPYHLHSWGTVTIDGEHPNNRGAQIIADQFAHYIKKWMDSL